MVDEAIDQCGGGRGVRKDGRPVAKGQVGREHETLPFVPAAHDLKQQVGGVCVYNAMITTEYRKTSFRLELDRLP